MLVLDQREQFSRSIGGRQHSRTDAFTECSRQLSNLGIAVEVSSRPIPIMHLPKLGMTPISSPVLLSFTETYMQQGEDTAGADVAVSVLDGRMFLQSRTSQTGDALWVARSKRDPQISYALDYVVERKSVKDLVGSIKNGRYERQKYVLQRCGLRRVLYLMEGNPDVEVQGVGASTKSSSDLLVRLAMMR